MTATDLAGRPSLDGSLADTTCLAPITAAVGTQTLARTPALPEIMT